MQNKWFVAHNHLKPLSQDQQDQDPQRVTSVDWPQIEWAGRTYPNPFSFQTHN